MSENTNGSTQPPAPGEEHPEDHLPPARVVRNSVPRPGEPAAHHDDEPPPGVRAMAIVRWLLVAVMAIIALAALEHRYEWLKREGSSESTTIYYCPMHPGVQQDHPGECPICSMTLVPKPKAGDVEAAAAAKAAMSSDAHGDGGAPAAAGPGAYYCPMHPEVTSDDPNAKCEKCGGMKLVPKPAAAATSPPASEGVPGLVPVTLTPERVQLMGMRTAAVVHDALATELRTVGTVTTTETGLAVIQTRFAGWIEVLRVTQTGQRVAKGQVLATVYSPELLAAQQEHLNAMRWGAAPDGGTLSGLSSGLAGDSRHRLELLGIAPPEIDVLERTGQPIRAIPVRSPVGGYVTQKTAVEGLYVQPGTALFQVADLSRVWVLADVYEYELGRVKVGQSASIELAAYPGETFAGKVAFVYPSLDAATRTLRIRIELKNPGLRLKPGMYGNVTVQLHRADALIVPADAVVDTGAMQYVFVAKPGGTFEPRKVKTGARAGGKVQVLAGVAAGETVVTTANFLLDSESHLQATILGGGSAPAAAGDACDTEIDKQKSPDKYQQCVACRVHRGMGEMEEDCRKQIPKPWK
jgi:Cu(I)/Ag(I) efflux system membrane fusion protein